MVTLPFYYRLFGLLLLCLFAGQAISGEIYAFIDSQGKLQVSRQKIDSRYVRFDSTRRITPRMVTGKTSWIVPQTVAHYVPHLSSRSTLPLKPSEQASSVTPSKSKLQQQYAELIDGIAQEIGVSANLLHAIIQVESAYNPMAISPKGAQGLMQLIPATAERFGVEHSFEPAANIRGGARYLKNLLALFNNDIKLAVAAYNAGEGAVIKYNNAIPPYPETQAYVSRVLSLFVQREK